MLYLHAYVPYDTHELPPDELHHALLTNVVFQSVLLFAVVMYAARQIAGAETRAENERARSGALLDSILPGCIAERLKEAPGRIIANRYDESSVLFADLADFTSQAGNMTPEELVRFLDQVFTAFDGLAARFGVEKIKTNGDGYMVAAGVPDPRPDHAQVLADFSISMLGTARSLKANVELRIGIASGPVAAGVVGTNKFYSDVWGDTVNIASRMESTAERGRIQVAESTAMLLAPGYRLEARGSIDIKGKGLLPTWYLNGKRAV